MKYQVFFIQILFRYKQRGQLSILNHFLTSPIGSPILARGANDYDVCVCARARFHVCARAVVSPQFLDRTLDTRSFGACRNATLLKDDSSIVCAHAPAHAHTLRWVQQ